MTRVFLHGLVVALASIAPIGVQNLFVINSAFSLPLGQALATAAAVFAFDMSLTLGAFFGVGSLLAAFPALRGAVLLAGGAVVVKIGVGLLCAECGELKRESRVFNMRKTVATAFVVTWLNPQAIVDTTLFFGAFRASLPLGDVLPFVCGCLTASPLWFVSVTLAISTLRARLGAWFLRALNVVCGAFVTFCGCKLLWNFISAFL